MNSYKIIYVNNKNLLNKYKRFIIQYRDNFEYRYLNI